MGKSAEKGCWWWLRRVKVSIRHLWQSKTANFLWEKWTLQYCCRCPIAEKYSTIQLLQSWFIRQPALYHCHLQPPSVLSHLTSSACVSYHHGNRHTRETWRRKKEREGERGREMAGVDSFANFALHLKVGTTTRYSGKGLHFSLFRVCVITCKIITDATNPRACFVAWSVLINHSEMMLLGRKAFILIISFFLF